MSLLINAKNLVAGYGGEPVLRRVNFAIDSGEIGVIVGPNGAGKTNALKSIFGLIKLS
ncbi:MAG: ATP-binding cassette domain-containing protein [Gammaproteobacteria bacterium]|nr:ATP-binding cassette domain-containing protein [Gammaproteobacteria bacterium]